MSTADLPALDLNQLNFDTCDRLRNLDWLLKQLGLPENAAVLDVGGYPCYMARAFPHWNVVTVDTYAKGHCPYVKGSGAALPFKDRAFAATVACDVLEHVPPQYRESFLRELARVTASVVIVAGPYDTPGATKAEMLVRDFLPSSSPAQAWLAEHEECGLPSLEETKRALGTTAAGTGVVAAGSLTSWLLLFAAQAAGESSIEVDAAVQRFIKSYNSVSGEFGASGGLGSTGPAYRHAVIAAQNAPAALKLSELQASQSMDSLDPDAVRQYVDALGDLIKLAMQNGVAPSGKASAADSGRAIDAEYLSRLERMLADRGLDNPAAETARMEQPFGQRLKQSVKVLLGRE